MSALNRLSLDDLRTKLSEAIDARHLLMTQATSISFSGRSMSYAQKLQDAETYINQLEAAITAKEHPHRPRGPIYLARG